MLGPKSRLGASRLTAPAPQATLPAGHAAGGRGAVTPGRQLWRGPWRSLHATMSSGITTRRAPLSHTSRSRSRRPRAQARAARYGQLSARESHFRRPAYGETAEVARRYPVLLTYPSVARRDMSGPASSRRGQNRPRGTAVVPTATSDASKQSTTGDDGGRWGRGWTHRRTRSLGWGPKGRRFKSVAGRPLPKRKITLDNLRQGRRADGAAQGDDLGVVIPDHPAIGSVGIAASQRSEPLEALAPYHSALDLPIVRVLADASLLSAVTDTEAP
jgi:hypothetical protein